MILTTFSSFQILGEKTDEPFETRLIGDSIVRGQLTEFAGRVPQRRKRVCVPGAHLDDITALCDDLTRDADSNTLYIIHAGTNDVESSGSEELMAKYERMIRRYKSKTNRLIVSGILPRIGAPYSFYDKAYSTNNRLKSLCSQEKIDFVDLWDNFYDDSSLFQDDGLHLDPVGDARLGRLFSDQVSLYRSKNALLTRQEAPT